MSNEMNTNVLDMNNIVYSYKVNTGNNVNVIRNAAGVFQEGKVYAVLGDEKSGKTTLLKLIASLDKVDDGVLKYRGQNVNDINQYDYRKKIVGCSIAELDLLDEYTAIENIVLQLDITDSVKESERVKKAQDLLNKVELDKSKENVRVNKLSVQEKQKVRLARALATGGDLILFDDLDLDEDKQAVEALFEIMKILSQKERLCIIYTTKQESVATFANEVYTINRGTVTIKR